MTNHLIITISLSMLSILLIKQVLGREDPGTEEARARGQYCRGFNGEDIPYPTPYIVSLDRADRCKQLFNKFNTSGTVSLTFIGQNTYHNPCKIECPLCESELPGNNDNTLRTYPAHISLKDQIAQCTENESIEVYEQFMEDGVRCGPTHLIEIKGESEVLLSHLIPSRRVIVRWIQLDNPSNLIPHLMEICYRYIYFKNGVGGQVGHQITQAVELNPTIYDSKGSSVLNVAVCDNLCCVSHPELFPNSKKRTTTTVAPQVIPSDWTIPLTCEEEGFYRNPNDCHKFYRCHELKGKFTKTLFNCNPTTAVFDEQFLVCVSPEDTDSCEDTSAGNR